jgi:hypothetical protein
VSTELWVTPDELSSPSDPAAYQSVLSASWLLWALSGRKYGGEHRITERYECPCRCNRRRWYSRSPQSPIFPVWHNGEIYNVSLCDMCDQTHRLRLRGRPVRSIESVSVQGDVLDPGAYEIHDSAYLAATSSKSPWSLCNQVTVTYTYGVLPPEAGRRAARLLAEELLKATIAPDECTLPDRVTSISRQGVSFTILDPQSFLDEGRLGIYEVDSFLRAVNPGKAVRPARVFSPDQARGVRVRAGTAALRVSDLNALVITPGEPFTRLFTVEDFDASLGDLAWHPSGQISMWKGAAQFPLGPYLAHQSSDPPGSIRLSLPDTATRVGSLQDGVFDVYAVDDTDEGTVIHILTGQVIIK